MARFLFYTFVFLILIFQITFALPEGSLQARKSHTSKKASVHKHASTHKKASPHKGGGGLDLSRLDGAVEKVAHGAGKPKHSNSPLPDTMGGFLKKAESQAGKKSPLPDTLGEFLKQAESQTGRKSLKSGSGSCRIKGTLNCLDAGKTKELQDSESTFRNKWIVPYKLGSIQLPGVCGIGDLNCFSKKQLKKGKSFTKKAPEKKEKKKARDLASFNQWVTRTSSRPTRTNHQKDFRPAGRNHQEDFRLEKRLVGSPFYPYHTGGVIPLRPRPATPPGPSSAPEPYPEPEPYRPGRNPLLTPSPPETFLPATDLPPSSSQGPSNNPPPNIWNNVAAAPPSTANNPNVPDSNTLLMDFHRRARNDPTLQGNLVFWSGIPGRAANDWAFRNGHYTLQDLVGTTYNQWLLDANGNTRPDADTFPFWVQASIAMARFAEGKHQPNGLSAKLDRYVNTSIGQAYVMIGSDGAGQRAQSVWNSYERQILQNRNIAIQWRDGSGNGRSPIYPAGQGPPGAQGPRPTKPPSHQAGGSQPKGPKAPKKMRRALWALREVKARRGLALAGGECEYVY